MTVCPVCLLENCEHPHPECSPVCQEKCGGCGARLRKPAALCGLCAEERALETS